MDEIMMVVVSLAEAAGADYQTMQRALGSLTSNQLLTLSQIAVSRAKQAIKEGR